MKSPVSGREQYSGLSRRPAATTSNGRSAPSLVSDWSCHAASSAKADSAACSWRLRMRCGSAGGGGLLPRAARLAGGGWGRGAAPAAPAHRAWQGGRRLSPSVRAGRLHVPRLLEHAEDLRDAAHEQALLVDLDPHAGGCREHDVVAGPDGHRDADVLPPVLALADREHDPVLGRRLVAAGRDEQAGAAEALGLELLDDDAVEEGSEDVLHARRRVRARAAVAA